MVFLAPFWVDIMSLDPCFYHFKKWSGEVAEGYQASFLGSKYKDEYTTTVRSPARTWQSEYPGPSEEYFEWVDLLESVLQAKEEFVFFELGAGYGRWSVNAAFAASQQGKRYKILAIEPEPSHFAWMEENLHANGLNPNLCDLVEAAVTTKNGETDFYIGDPTAWYGQSVKVQWWSTLPDEMKMKGVEIAKVKTVTLNEYLEKYDKVDLVDMDVQYSELDILRASQDLVNRNVKRVHIGTHSHDIEKGLRKLFDELGWTPKFDFECVGDRQTPRGVVSFLDGVQSWINPAL